MSSLGITTIPHNGVALLSTQNTATDGTGALGTTLMLLFKAGAQGSWLSEIRWKATNSFTNDTVLRVFLNNGTDFTVAANNSLIHEELFTGPFTFTQTTETPEVVWQPDNGQLPAGWCIYVTESQSSPIAVSAFGGDYPA